jgi:uncharacterized protein (TIGR00297 family)
MINLWVALLSGLVLSALIGYAGYHRGMLARSGWLGALVTGTIVFGFGGFAAALLLIAFFVSSSALTRYRAASKLDMADVFAKGGRRDFGQAMANGGIATLAAIIFGLTTNPIAFAAFTGALAAANADTWATELGVLAQRSPRLITTGREVLRGTSGGVTLAGTLAAIVGAMSIGLLAALLRSDGSLLPIALIAGTLGSLFDSLLGATVQGIYYSEVRRTETERAIDRDGTPNRLVRGMRWINNDVVNFASTLIGALIAGAISR